MSDLAWAMVPLCAGWVVMAGYSWWKVGQAFDAGVEEGMRRARREHQLGHVRRFPAARS